MGARKSLGSIIDDPRISMDPHEYDRILQDFKYYSDLYPKRIYIDIEGKKQERPFNSINMTKRASMRLASIVFNEQCKISFENQNISDFVNGVLEANNFKDDFEENLEKGIAIGGFAIRPYVDNDHIKLAWVRADQFYPLRSNTSHIGEAAIASRTTRSESDQPVYYTLLEFHQWDNGNYVITNELYRSTDRDTTGVQVDLHSIYPDLQEKVTMNGDSMVHSLFSYFKMPGANNINIESPLGLGIVDNSKHTLDNINLTHDNLMWEIKQGKRRIAAPAQMFKFDKAHKPVYDTDTDVFMPLNSEEDMKIQDLTSPMRIDDYSSAMNVWLRELEGNIGMADGTFSFDPKTGIQTATGVVSQNSMTYQTRSSIITKTTETIEGLVKAILELAGSAELFSTGAKVDLSKVDLNDLGMSIHYDDGVFVDKDAQAKQDMLAVSSGIMPKVQYLMRNYGLSEEDAQAWLAQVQSETPEPAPSTESGLFGGDGGGGNDDNLVSGNDG